MPHPPIIPHSEWRALSAAHRAKAQKWTEPCRARRASRQKHPVFDFLFTYYPFSMGRLEQWHPGLDTILESGNAGDYTPKPFQGKHYRHDTQGITLDRSTLSDKERFRIRHIHNLLALTQNRTPNFSCFGMHEWAMVYRGNDTAQGGDIRHRESAPLRLTQAKIDQVVEERPLCCSHFDAVRFFAPAALPMNKLQPTLDLRHEFEQPACLHSNMDLYKWASKCMPWVGSHLLWRCFQLALSARELDMRASAYDLVDYGYSPVKVETHEGREEYENLQRKISDQAKPLRQELMDCLSTLLGAPSPSSAQPSPSH